MDVGVEWVCSGCSLFATSSPVISSPPLEWLFMLVWCVVCGVWCVVRGVWCVVCGVWCVVCGVWCVVCLCLCLRADYEFVSGAKMEILWWGVLRAWILVLCWVLIQSG